VPALWIVKHLGVIEDITPCLFPSAVCLASDPFPFHELEEALGHGVIVAISSSAHALLQIVLVQEVAPVVAAELTALIRMHHHPVLGLPTQYSHQERIHRYLAIDSRTHQPADYLTRKQVQYNAR